MRRRHRVGVLGGTFDPIHFGHLLMARETQRTLGLDSVLFVPVGTPAHRDPSVISSARDRCEMVRLALKNVRRYALSTVDVLRPGPTYTVETIRSLRAEYGPDTDFYVIVGADNLADLPRWKESARLVNLAKIVGCSRPGYRLWDPGLPSGTVTLLNVLRHEISATRIRRYVRDGRTICHMTPSAVVCYINDRGLYAGKPVR
jgi:nicotinate-nucleotide adenylyltransferase